VEREQPNGEEGQDNSVDDFLDHMFTQCYNEGEGGGGFRLPASSGASHRLGLRRLR